MPGNKSSSSWGDSAFLEDLCLALFTVGQSGGAFTPDMKESVEQYLKGRGYTQTWEAVRQHIQKLRKARDTSGLQSPAGVSKKSSPAKPKTPSGKRKQGAFKPFNFGLDDDDIKPEYSEDDSALGGSPVAKRIKAEDGLATEDA